MNIWDGMIRDYLAGRDLAEYREMWYFADSFIAREAGRNLFEAPGGTAEERQKVETVYRELSDACGAFAPLNREVWDALFPGWAGTLAEVRLDLILGLPEPYDAVVASDAGGVRHVLFDLYRWTKYLGHGSLAGAVRNLLTHELTHVLLHAAVPGLADARDGDYPTALDAITFDEGFAHLLSFRGKALGEVDWNGSDLREVRERSVQRLKEAMLCRDEAAQRDFLHAAQRGAYYDKFACMAGMLFLAELWERGGVHALAECLKGGCHGFAEQCTI